jgi:ribosomal protein S18 acetylase RimI-like enzyme
MPRRDGDAPARPAGSDATAAWSWRLARPEDAAFLDELYAGTRLDEVLGWGFDAATAASFLREQARLQRGSYALQFREAEHRLLLAEGAPAGRLILSRATEGWSIVDLAVSRPWRGRGLGTWALRAALEEARGAAREVQLCVDAQNPARRLYDRLGFRQAPADAGAPADGLQPIVMRWRPR